MIERRSLLAETFMQSEVRGQVAMTSAGGRKVSKVANTQSVLGELGIDGWLMYDFQHSNPVFWEWIGREVNPTRRCFLLVRAEDAKPVLAVHFVDKGLFEGLDFPKMVYESREDLEDALMKMLKGLRTVAMEYSPQCAIPYLSRVDAGTMELVRKSGVDIVSSADLIGLTQARWDEADLATHMEAAKKIEKIKDDAFGFIGSTLQSGRQVTEFDVQQLIMQSFEAEALLTEDRPIVAVNENSADPHYEPSSVNCSEIRWGDWLLIDLWARTMQEGSMFADITWVAYIGRRTPSRYADLFEVVRRARDLAIDVISKAFQRDEIIQGWQVDRSVRDFIWEAGYGRYFVHRTGHSLGSRTLHGNGVCLDDFETHDTRQIVPGAAFSVEPGIYLPEFGVRSEVNVYVSSGGPTVTTCIQEGVVEIGS